MSLSFHDALVKSTNGQALVVQARAIPERIRLLKQLVHDTFVRSIKDGGFRPINQLVRWDVYKAARNRVHDLGQVGGKEFDAAVTAVKYTWVSPRDYQAAIKAVTYEEDLDSVHETEHDVRSYESGDHYSR